MALSKRRAATQCTCYSARFRNMHLARQKSHNLTCSAFLRTLFSNFSVRNSVAASFSRNLFAEQYTNLPIHSSQPAVIADLTLRNIFLPSPPRAAENHREKLVERFWIELPPREKASVFRGPDVWCVP